MMLVDISEYDPEKKYSDGTEFVLNDTPPALPVPKFLNEGKENKD